MCSCQLHVIHMNARMQNYVRHTLKEVEVDNQIRVELFGFKRITLL
jgi:hypothetical protein